MITPDRRIFITASTSPPRSRAETAAELVAGLATGLRPGERIGTKEDLRRRAGVAVGTFNEAVRLLVSRGVVSVRPGPGGGLFVAEPSPTVRLGSAVLALRPGDVTVPHALAVRDALDPLVVDDAVRHASATDVADLTALLDEMRAATGEPEAFLDANWRLHLRMARISPNPILRSLYSGLMAVVRDRTGRITATGAGAAAHRRARYALHADLVAAIAAGDRARAGALAAAHHQPVGGVPGATARPGG